MNRFPNRFSAIVLILQFCLSPLAIAETAPEQDRRTWRQWIADGVAATVGIAWFLKTPSDSAAGNHGDDDDDKDGSDDDHGGGGSGLGLLPAGRSLKALVSARVDGGRTLPIPNSIPELFSAVLDSRRSIANRLEALDRLGRFSRSTTRSYIDLIAFNQELPVPLVKRAIAMRSEGTFLDRSPSTVFTLINRFSDPHTLQNFFLAISHTRKYRDIWSDAADLVASLFADAPPAGAALQVMPLVRPVVAPLSADMRALYRKLILAQIGEENAERGGQQVRRLFVSAVDSVEQRAAIARQALSARELAAEFANTELSMDQRMDAAFALMDRVRRGASLQAAYHQRYVDALLALGKLYLNPEFKRLLPDFQIERLLLDFLKIELKAKLDKNVTASLLNPVDRRNEVISLNNQARIHAKRVASAAIILGGLALNELEQNRQVANLGEIIASLRLNVMKVPEMKPKLVKQAWILMGSLIALWPHDVFDLDLKFVVEGHRLSDRLELVDVYEMLITLSTQYADTNLPLARNLKIYAGKILDRISQIKRPSSQPGQSAGSAESKRSS